MKKISIVVNIYVNTIPEQENTYDHATDFNQFDMDNTFVNFYNSVKKLNIPDGHVYDLFVFAIAANNDVSKDIEIKQKISGIAKEAGFDVFVITNSDVYKLKKEGNTFLSVDGYCEIRNLGFIFPYHNNSDFVIQFDDDEIARQNYLVRMIELYDANPDIYSINALYEKDNSVIVDESSDMKCWKKCSMMNEDFSRLSELTEPIESIFGLGGNMTFKREYFSQICYPEKVSRGEDFALLLSARLVYAKGNDKCGITVGNQKFKSYFVSDEEMIIIHEPPVSAPKKHKLKLDFTRFIMQKALLKDHLSMDELYKLSRYIYRMLSIKDYLGFAKEVYKEAAKINPKAYPEDFINSELADIKELLNEYEKRDLFEEYKNYQKQYIKSLQKNCIDVNKYLVDKR
jgi:hypothetical protein